MKTHLSLDPGLAMGGTNPPGPPSAQTARLLSVAGQTKFQTFPRDQSPIIHPSVKSGDWRGEGQRAQELRDQSSGPLITDSAAENQVGKPWPR